MPLATKDALDPVVPFGRLATKRNIVTNFTIGAGQQTLPIWIFSNLFRPQQLPVVNAVAVLVILISIVPVYLAHRLGGEAGTPSRGGGGGVETEATAVP